MPCIIHAWIFWKKCLCGLHVLFKIFVVLFISVSPTGLFSEPNVLYFAKISEIYRHIRQSERNFQLLFYKILSLQQESERITYEIYQTSFNSSRMFEYSLLLTRTVLSIVHITLEAHFTVAVIRSHSVCANGVEAADIFVLIALICIFRMKKDDTYRIYLALSRSRLQAEIPNFQFVNSAAPSRKIKPKHSL